MGAFRKKKEKVPIVWKSPRKRKSGADLGIWGRPWANIDVRKTQADL